MIDERAPAPTDAALDRPSSTPEAIARATRDGIERADRRLAEGLEAAMATPSPTFEAVFGPLDDAARIAGETFGQGAFLREVAPEAEVRQAASDAVDALDRWKAELPQRPEIIAAVAAVAETIDPTTLDPDQAALLRNWQADIRLSGAGLGEAGRAEVQQGLGRLVELQGQFIMNLGAVRHLELRPDELDGVPRSIVQGLASGSAPGTLDVPMTDAVISAILESGTRRDVRQRVVHEQLNTGMPGNEATLDEAIAIRRRLAELLGAPSWLAIRAERFAAGSPEVVTSFIDDMASRLGPLADAELARMRDALAGEPGWPPDGVLEDWDWRHADALQRRAAGVDPESLRDYLGFEDVFAGLQAMSEEVFGVRFEARPERRGWHPDVRAFDLVDRDSGRLIAHLFVDPFVREGKQRGAFAGSIDPGDPRAGRQRTQLLVTNAPSPADGPSLLGAQEVDMLFHEYGHVLADALERSPFVCHRFEAWIPMDWIEGPSQFLGRWGLHPAVLGRYARHHRTGEPVPPELLSALAGLESLNTAVRSLRFLSMGRLDVLLHGPDEVSAREANQRSWAMRGTPMVDDTYFPAGLIHLLGGYEGAVYGFVWSQVLRDDLLSRFEREGLTSPTVGAEYRRDVLEHPWSRNPLDGLAAFLGRPWNADAFLARAARTASA